MRIYSLALINGDECEYDGIIGSHDQSNINERPSESGLELRSRIQRIILDYLRFYRILAW